MEVYVDDMLVKSTEEDRHITDLKEAFGELRKHQIKLNPNKCTFGVTIEKFLKFLITQRGIEANLEKIQALLDMKPPSSIKEVWQLTGRLRRLADLYPGWLKNILHSSKY